MAFSPVAFAVGLFLLALAPLVRGGNRYLALIGLEWLGLLVVWLVVTPWLLRRPASARAQGAAPLSWGEWGLILSPLWASLLFLTPVSHALWVLMPGRSLYLDTAEMGWRALSLTPDATLTSVLAGIPVVAVGVLARTVPASLLRALPPALVLMALLQAVWGLLQMGQFQALYFGAEFAGRPIGSFASANHFANYIAMTLPLAVLMLRRAMVGLHTGQGQRAEAVLWSLALLMLLGAVLASSSRTGGVTALLVTLLAVLLLLDGLSRNARRWYGLGAGLLLLAVLVTGGVSSLTARLDMGRLNQDASIRRQLAGSSLQAARAFWPLGAGPGSFAAVYPQFQPPGLDVSVEHAHNDYVELLVEGGALFAALAGLTAWLILRQALALWRQIRRAGQVPDSVQFQLCCGLGLLAVLLHSWVEFNLRIPANAMLSASLLGVFLRPVRPGS